MDVPGEHLLNEIESDLAPNLRWINFGRPQRGQQLNLIEVLVRDPRALGTPPKLTKSLKLAGVLGQGIGKSSETIKTVMSVAVCYSFTGGLMWRILPNTPSYFIPSPILHIARTTTVRVLHVIRDIR
jgi:hypothetical protein